MATSKVLKPRRGSTTEHATFKGQAFEITFDTDKKTIVAHDGLTMGGFPLAHEAAVVETDSALRELIDQKVAEVEGVSSSELSALESALRGLINNNVQQQTVRDADQDNVITVLDTSLRALIAEEVAKAMAAANAKLPLSGGKLSGMLQLSDYGALTWDPSIPAFIVRYQNGGTPGSGIFFRPHNAQTLPGAVVINTKTADNTSGKSFILSPDGDLTNQLGTFPYIVAQGGSSASWYRKWSDGLIEQCGYVTASSSSPEAVTSVTFATPFAKAYPAVIVTPNGGGTRAMTLTNVSKTGFSAMGWNRSAAADAPPYFFYYAAGY